jgi:hypothetical protein
MDLVIAVGGLILWLALLIFQLADLSASLLDVRNARNGEENDRHSRRRFADYFWAIPLAAALGLGLVLGVDVAARLLFVGAQPVQGLIVLLGLAALILFGAIGVVIAFTRGDELSYASIRASILDAGGHRLSKKQIELLRSQVAEVDARERELKVGRLASLSQREMRRELDSLVREFRAEPPRGLAAFDAIRWRIAARYLWGASWWRLVPVVAALVPILALAFGGNLIALVADVPIVALLLVPIPLSYLLALTSARAALSAKVTWHAVGQAQRSEVEELITNLERTSRKGVAGLGERVARALQILREQQG